jgi:hypothetical protein
MVLILVLALIAIRTRLTISDNNITRSFWVFGFDQGGTFSISIHPRKESVPIFVGLVPRSMADYLSEANMSSNPNCFHFVCTENISLSLRYVKFWPEITNTSTFNGTIRYDMWCYMYVIAGACQELPADTTVEISYELKNPHSHVSNDVPILVWLYVMLSVLLGFYLVIWLRSWSINSQYSIRNVLHNCFTLFFIYAFVAYIVSAVDIICRSRGKNSGFFVRAFFVRLIEDLWLLCILAWIAIEWLVIVPRPNTCTCVPVSCLIFTVVHVVAVNLWHIVIVDAINPDIIWVGSWIIMQSVNYCLALMEFTDSMIMINVRVRVPRFSDIWSRLNYPGLHYQDESWSSRFIFEIPIQLYLIGTFVYLFASPLIAVFFRETALTCCILFLARCFVMTERSKEGYVIIDEEAPPDHPVDDHDLLDVPIPDMNPDDLDLESHNRDLEWQYNYNLL